MLVQIKFSNVTIAPLLIVFASKHTWLEGRRTYLPFVGLEGGTIGHGVEEWPEGGVAAAVVVVTEHLLGDCDGQHLQQQTRKTR